jgi:hypothetical protein
MVSRPIIGSSASGLSRRWEDGGLDFDFDDPALNALLGVVETPGDPRADLKTKDKLDTSRKNAGMIVDLRSCGQGIAFVLAHPAARRQVGKQVHDHPGVLPARVQHSG